MLIFSKIFSFLSIFYPQTFKDLPSPSSRHKWRLYGSERISRYFSETKSLFLRYNCRQCVQNTVLKQVSSVRINYG